MSLPELRDYALIQDMTVAWGEMDAFGHVNNAVYYRYFESVRIAYLQAIGALDRLEECNPVVAANSCRFLRPLTWPDALRVGARVAEVRGSGFRMEYAIYSRKQQAVVATGDAVVVIVDASGAKMALPERVRGAIDEIEKARSASPPAM